MSAISVHPLTPGRWEDLVDLFGPRGASSGCWCMWHRVGGRPEWTALGPEGRREAFAALASAGAEPGLLAYEDGKAIGWCAVAPRSDLPRFQTQKVSQPGVADGREQSTFVVNCFYTRAGHRKRGLMRLLATAAVDFARGRGATAIEACPIEPDRPLTWGEGFVGFPAVFRDLGFREIARRSPRRPLMRLDLP